MRGRNMRRAASVILLLALTFTSLSLFNIKPAKSSEIVNVSATIEFYPKTLNLQSKEKWFTTYIELPEGYNVSDIKTETIMLNGSIPLSIAVEIGDYDNDTIPDLMINFNRTLVCEYILSQGKKFGNVTLTVSGELYDGTEFEGSSIILVKMPGDTYIDGLVDMKDIVLAASTFGSTPENPRWNPAVDENEDGMIDLKDITLICKKFGTIYK
jgi:hypothetical protein